MYNIEKIVLILLLIDSIACNTIAWLGNEKWYIRHFRIISKNFPMTRGWTTYYLLLVLWIGVVMYSFGALAH